MAKEGGLLRRVGASVSALRQAMRGGRSMRLAVLIYLLSLAGILMLGVVLLLSAAGVFRSGRDTQRGLMANDLAHVASDILSDYEAVSAMCVSYAKLCAKELEAGMLADGFRARELAAHPDSLESLLQGAYAPLSAALVRSRASGAFLMLDATVNPALPNAENSRACLYLRNMEPNIVNATDPYLQLLRGPASVAREGGIGMHAQWEMELNVPHDGVWRERLSLAAQSGRKLAHSYFWLSFEPLGSSADRTMLCVAPLVASDGSFMGACGFEVSAMLFALSYAPDYRTTPQSFVLLAPADGNAMDLSRAFTAGGGVGLGSDASLGSLEGVEKGFISLAVGRRAYAGPVQTLSLYPSDSPFAQEKLMVALMMPMETLQKAAARDIGKFTLLLSCLMAAAFLASLYMSKRFTKPLSASLQTLGAADESTAKTGILEIDALINSLEARPREKPAPQGGAEETRYALLREFAAGVATLSAAERAVFDLYYEGDTAEEIAKKLFLSINTIKTHSKHIYIKLNVSSRKELLVYAAMLKEEAARHKKTVPL